MRRNYDLQGLLSSITGYKGLPFPGSMEPMPRNRRYTDYKLDTSAPPRQEFTQKGSRLWAQHEGRWYFMPVALRWKDKSYELPLAVISLSGQKTIVETPMPGRKGSVKELISMEDSKISVTGMVLSSDGSYPEKEVERLKELIDVNESVEIVCALTDMLLSPDDRVVIKAFDFPPTPGVEDAQAVKLELVTDSPFELIIS